MPKVLGYRKKRACTRERAIKEHTLKPRIFQLDERRVKELTLPLYDSIFSMADEVMNDELLVSKAVSR